MVLFYLFLASSFIVFLTRVRNLIPHYATESGSR